MKLESNKLLGGGGGGGGGPGEGERRAEPSQTADEIIDDILAEFAPPQRPAPPTRTPSNSLSEGGLDDIDPASDLGASIRDKCLELEEILRSLKTRLKRVVVDENIVLSPDANSLEAELERDMDTDVQEDLSLQEFLQLLQGQDPPAHAASPSAAAPAPARAQ